MHFGFLIIGIITCYIWIYKCTGAIPTVTLTASSSPYFDIGGSISFTCSISEDVGIKNVHLTNNGNYTVWIFINNASSCTSHKWLPLLDPHNYSITCEQGTIVHIVMNGTVASDNNTVWGCNMSAESGICNSPCISTSTVRTALRVPVSSIQLTDGTGQLLVTPVPVIDGSSKVFRCDTYPNGSRPRALFNWYKRSENQSPILIQDQSVSTPGPKPEVDLSMSISYSTLTLMGNRSYHNMYIYCEARDETNRGNFLKSTEAQLNIVYPPVVQLLPNGSVFNVTEGLMKFEFICNVTDANPIPQPDGYSWFHGGSVIQGQTRSSYELLNVQKSQDGMYQCMARNKYGTRNSSTVDLNVQYGPSISLIDYTEVVEGENVSIACSVTANPQPDIVWSRNGTVILPSSDTLRIPYISRLNEGNYTCTASNVLCPTGQAPVSQMATDTLTISILYGPGISIYLTPNSSVYQVDEGHKAIDIICSATCNPACSYRWIKGNVQINSSNTLSLGIVQKNVTGNYSCEAFNTIRGQRKGSNKSLEVIVRYGAEIINVSVTEGTTVNENTTATLRCLVDSNPESNITWTKQGIMGALQTNLSVRESQLIIENAECLDTSNYTCNARNGVGQPVERKVPLFVTCHPRTDFRSPPVTMVYSKRHRNASLNYTVISFPEPMFNWSFIGNGSESKQLPDSATKYDSGLQSVLIFTNLSIHDFGFYKVIAKNTLPKSVTEVFQLIPADVPDIPSNVTVADVKQTSLTVHWVAGYDGGLKQTFHIMITASDITRSVYAPDPGYGKLGTQTIEDLIPNTEYSISMSANNSLGSSNVTNVIILITLKVQDNPVQDNPSRISAISGGVVVAVVALLLVGISIILWRRYQHKKKNVDENDLNNDFRQRESTENGLRDNPVYDSSDVRPGPLAEYATVDKSKKKNFHKEDLTNLYAQVDKTTKSGQKNAVKGKHGKKSRGDIYENATLFGRSSNKEIVCENPEAGTSCENVYENPGATASTGTLVKTNGLLYADLMLDPPTTKNHKPVIRGLENQTEYAEIAYGKRGEPLPDNDEEKEHGSINKYKREN